MANGTCTGKVSYGLRVRYARKFCHTRTGESGDFTAEFRLVGISAIAVVIGAICGVLALVLLRLIELFTNLFYFQEWSFRLHLPASSTLGWLAVLVPVVGGLIVGLMATISPILNLWDGIGSSRLFLGG